jgi:hypothetical protein
MSTAPETTKPKANLAALAVVVFGRDEAGKPHAAWFDQGEASLAEKAADLMGLRVLRVHTDEHRALAAQLPHGRVFASGRAFVPFVKAALFLQLQTAAQAAADVNRRSSSPMPPMTPRRRTGQPLSQSPRRFRRSAKRRAAGPTSMWAALCWPPRAVRTAGGSRS